MVEAPAQIEHPEPLVSPITSDAIGPRDRGLDAGLHAALVLAATRLD